MRTGRTSGREVTHLLLQRMLFKEGSINTAVLIPRTSGTMSSQKSKNDSSAEEAASTSESEVHGKVCVAAPTWQEGRGPASAERHHTHHKYDSACVVLFNGPGRAKRLVCTVTGPHHLPHQYCTHSSSMPGSNEARTAEANVS